jgi:excisionase family DNA binding protein
MEMDSPNWWGSERIILGNLLTKREYLAKARAGEIVNVHPARIERAIQTGELMAYELEGSVLIRRRDLDAWAETNAIEQDAFPKDI